MNTENVSKEQIGNDANRVLPIVSGNGDNKKCMGFRSSNLSAYIELN